MKTLIKEITSVTAEGVCFNLTHKAALSVGRLSASKYFISWDKIGEALFGDQYFDTTNLEMLRKERGDIQLPEESK